jgi:choline monooxygenase
VFVHQHRLEYLLKPAHYHDPGHYRTELERLFLPGWHLVATRPDLPRPGDFRTFELFGRPVLLRNIDGGYHAFLNVCAHRHCLLTSEPCGHSPTLRCQYHGWEYTREGRTGKIPDAGCFRPWDRDNARLVKFRTATCGDLIFLSLAPEGPSLADHFGPYYEKMAGSFGPPFRPVWQWRVDFPANWKVPVENTLEMYHIPCIHRKTFGVYAREEDVTHLLGERSTTLHTREYYPRVTAVQNWMVRRLAGEITNVYTHHHAHPNLIFTATDVMRMATAFVPTSPTTTSQWVWLYALHGRRKGPLARLVGWALKKCVVGITRAILKEDVPIFAQQQPGLQASPHPGVLGTLEERLYAFHRYLLKGCGGGAAVEGEGERLKDGERQRPGS